MGWPYRLEDVEKTAEYVFKKYMESPLIQRWLGLNAAAVAGAADARLAAGIAQLRNASLLIGAADLALTLGVPLAVWVGVFAALGAPYAEARALVRNENFLSGFSQGFVAGLLEWQWHQVVARFFRFSPGQMNYFDESLSFIAANARNEGLRAGFVHARSLNEVAKKAILHRLRSLSPHTKAGHWDRLDQIAYVIDLASAGRRHNIFKTA
jgi:hypothetical protein